MGYEFVQGGIEQTYRYAKSVHRFEDTLEVAALHRQEFVKSMTATVFVFGKNHFSHGFDACAFEEHMFGTA